MALGLASAAIYSYFGVHVKASSRECGTSAFSSFDARRVTRSHQASTSHSAATPCPHTDTTKNARVCTSHVTLLTAIVSIVLSSCLSNSDAG